MSVDAVKLLMDKAEDIEETSKNHFERQKKKLEEELRASNDKVKSLRKSAQEICSHGDTYEVDDFDHHRGENWAKVYCSYCHKYLKRY